MKKIYLALSVLMLIASCSSAKTVDVKSPCVSKDGGPCGPKKSINDWWMHESNVQI